MCLLALRSLQINPSDIDTKNRHSWRIYVCSQSCPTFCDLMDYSLPGSSVHGMDSPDKNTGVGCHALLQGIFLTQGSNSNLLHLLHYRWIFYH